MALFNSPYLKSGRRPVKQGYAGDGIPGFGDPAAGVGSFHTSGTPSFGGKPLNPLYQQKTAAEVIAYRNKSGIAPTAQNTGSLAVQYRADEATAREGGGQSVGDKRAQKVIDTRQLDEAKRLKSTKNAKLAFEKRASTEEYDSLTRKAPRSGRTGGHTQAPEYPNKRTTERGLSKAQRPNSSQRPNSPYGLF